MEGKEAIKILLDELKAEGVELAEESAKSATKAILKAVVKYAAASENKVDDLLAVIIPVVEPKIMELLEGINKADNA